MYDVLWAFVPPLQLLHFNIFLVIYFSWLTFLLNFFIWIFRPHLVYFLPVSLKFISTFFLTHSIYCFTSNTTSLLLMPSYTKHMPFPNIVQSVLPNILASWAPTDGTINLIQNISNYYQFVRFNISWNKIKIPTLTKVCVALVLVR